MASAVQDPLLVRGAVDASLCFAAYWGSKLAYWGSKLAARWNRLAALRPGAPFSEPTFLKPPAPFAAAAPPKPGRSQVARAALSSSGRFHTS